MFKKRDLKSFYQDIDELYAWMDTIYKVNCVKNCNKCCQKDIIWVLLPELIRFNELKKPTPVEYGCPWRTETGCSIYSVRGLVCRSYGAKFIAPFPEPVTIATKQGSQSLFGPGTCVEYSLEGTYIPSELKQIYECYASLANTWGLVAFGTCEDISLQVAQEQSIQMYQELQEDYVVYVKDGIPIFKKK